MTEAILTPERKAQLDEVKTALNAFVGSPAIDSLGYLWSRWQDEKEYENFDDYGKQMEKLLAEHGNVFKFVKATKRPFGIQCSHAYLPKRTIAITVTGNAIKWKVS